MSTVCEDSTGDTKNRQGCGVIESPTVESPKIESWVLPPMSQTTRNWCTRRRKVSSAATSALIIVEDQVLNGSAQSTVMEAKLWLTKTARRYVRLCERYNRPPTVVDERLVQCARNCLHRSVRNALQTAEHYGSYLELLREAAIVEADARARRAREQATSFYTNCSNQLGDGAPPHLSDPQQRASPPRPCRACRGGHRWGTCAPRFTTVNDANEKVTLPWFAVPRR